MCDCVNMEDIVEFNDRSILLRVKKAHVRNESFSHLCLNQQVAEHPSRLTPRLRTSNRSTDFTFVPKRIVDTSERERERDGHVESGPSARVFLLPRGDARQKCNRWCGATRCNYCGNSRHAEFDAGHPADTPCLCTKTTPLSPWWKEARLKFQPDTSSSSPSKKRLSPRNVCTYPLGSIGDRCWNRHRWHTCSPDTCLTVL